MKTWRLTERGEWIAYWVVGVGAIVGVYAFAWIAYYVGSHLLGVA